jgi:hypothetical protein
MLSNPTVHLCSTDQTVVIMEPGLIKADPTVHLCGSVHLHPGAPSKQ